MLKPKEKVDDDKESENEEDNLKNIRNQLIKYN